MVGRGARSSDSSQLSLGGLEWGRGGGQEDGRGLDQLVPQWLPQRPEPCGRAVPVLTQKPLLLSAAHLEGARSSVHIEASLTVASTPSMLTVATLT